MPAGISKVCSVWGRGPGVTDTCQRPGVSTWSKKKASCPPAEGLAFAVHVLRLVSPTY